MEVSSVRVGEVRIQGVESGYFLAMNDRGRIYSEVSYKNIIYESPTFILNAPPSTH